MPNWCFNYGTISVRSNTPNDGRLAFQKLADEASKERWFGRVLSCPKEMHLGVGSTQGQEEYMTLEWLETNSDFQGDFGDFSTRFKASPEYEQYLQETFGALSWYTWNINNYGCKWDVFADVTVISKEELEFSFDSPWGPPIAFFQFLTDMGLDVTLGYDEPGQEFCGTFSCTAGEIVDEYYEGDEYRVHRLEDGEDIQYLYWSLQDFDSLEDWLKENEMPDHPKLVTAIKNHYAE